MIITGTEEEEFEPGNAVCTYCGDYIKNLHDCPIDYEERCNAFCGFYLDDN